jgi:hypothetical protein
MATERWIAGSGQGLSWGSAGFGSELNSLVSGNAVIAGTALDNSSALDVFADLSISLGSITPGSGAPYIGLYLYPLNQDGSSYGDGRFGSSAAGPPPSQYYVGAIPCVPSTVGVITGAIRGIVIPPGQWKLVLYNLAGATLASGSNTVKYRTYNRAVA